jgi:hypothetical protein
MKSEFSILSYSRCSVTFCHKEVMWYPPFLKLFLMCLFPPFTRQLNNKHNIFVTTLPCLRISIENCL